MGKKSRNKSKKAKQTSKGASPRSSNRKFIFTAVILVAVGAMVVGYNVFGKGVESRGPADTAQAIEKLKGGETKPVLSPALFVGKTAGTYRIAQENPDLLDAMYCYCHCSKSIGHKSLLSCFTDNHAANCGICQDEALYAYSLQNDGYDIPEIREKLDQKYWKPLR